MNSFLMMFISLFLLLLLNVSIALPCSYQNHPPTQHNKRNKPEFRLEIRNQLKIDVQHKKMFIQEDI